MNMNQFLQDVKEGLSSPSKYLQSKYFYDAAGDVIFQQIMNCPEYYLTRSEMEIFTTQTKQIADIFINDSLEFDIVELGAGDATKSVHLLKELLSKKVSFTYFPVDISTHVIHQLNEKLPAELPGLKLEGLNGEYFTMLKKAKTISNKIKVVLFLGSNIGNIPLENCGKFCSALRGHLNIGDLVLIGFDLQKEPQVILDAYNDKGGFTRNFNLNLLRRINHELSGNFEVNQFKHYASYDPASGACKSYLISLKDQQVEIADHTFSFAKYEPVYMEVSQKFTVAQTNEMAINNGFKPVHHFYDSKGWFVDAVWQCV